MSELIYEKFGKILSDDVVQKLVGIHDDFKVYYHQLLPSKNYCLNYIV